MSKIFFCLLPGVNGYGSVCHEPLPITNISSRFFRRQGEGCHFRLRAPANHLASTFLPPWSGNFVRATRCHPSQVTVNSISSHPTSIVSLGYYATIYIYIYKIWFSFNRISAKSSLYIYIKYIWFGLVGFYGISTIVGYLMPNPLYTHTHIYTCIYIRFGLVLMAYQPL